MLPRGRVPVIVPFKFDFEDVAHRRSSIEALAFAHASDKPAGMPYGIYGIYDNGH